MPTLAESDRTRTWQTYRAELFRFVLARVGEPALADDIVHDVLLKAFARMEALEDPGKLRAWLYRIARNVLVDHYRSRRPSEPLPADLTGEDEGEVAQVQQKLARCLTPLLDGLPAPYRRALTLAEIEGLPQREIAEREGVSLSGAKSRVQRARAMLRDALLSCCRIELDQRGGVVDYQTRQGCGSCETPTGCGSGRTLEE